MMKKLKIEEKFSNKKSEENKLRSKENSLNIPKDSSIYKEMPVKKEDSKAESKLSKSEKEKDVENKSPGLLTPQIRSRRLSMVSKHISGNKYLNISKLQRKENNNGSKSFSF